MLDENWIYRYKDKSGFTWDKDITLHITGWTLSAQMEGINLQQDQTFTTGCFYYSFVHPNLKAFRSFAGNKADKDELQLITLDVNHGNPFVTDTATIAFQNLKKKQIEGTLSCEDQTVTVDESLTVKQGYKTIVLDAKDRKKEYKRLLFDVKGDVTCTTVDQNYIVHNGVLSFTGNPDYADVIYSLQFDDHEWLDHTFPTVESRAWWGAFTGGITSRISGVQDIVLLQEPRKMEFVTLKDNYDQEWTGIKSSVCFTHDEDMKGVTIESYTLTRGNLPLLYTFANIINHSGKFFNKKNVYKFTSVQADDNPKNVSFTLGNTTYKCGDIGIEKPFENLLQLHSTREYKISMFNKNGHTAIDTQSDYTFFYSEDWLTIPDTTSKQLQGDMIFFTKETLDKEDVQDLKNITFEV